MHKYGQDCAAELTKFIDHNVQLAIYQMASSDSTNLPPHECHIVKQNVVKEALPAPDGLQKLVEFNQLLKGDWDNTALGKKFKAKVNEILETTTGAGKH
ncbi:hypothetical protein HDV00_001921 [Rhizophlyctis rosea]|nr:hypothetical protein HDV00_001921 [Rhizophlyctis rosea]